MSHCPVLGGLVAQARRRPTIKVGSAELQVDIRNFRIQNFGERLPGWSTLPVLHGRAREMLRARPPQSVFCLVVAAGIRCDALRTLDHAPAEKTPAQSDTSLSMPGYPPITQQQQKACPRADMISAGYYRQHRRRPGLATDLSGLKGGWRAICLSVVPASIRDRTATASQSLECSVGCAADLAAVCRRTAQRGLMKRAFSKQWLA
jgi:hypothetical protein